MMATAGGGTSRSAIAMSLWWLQWFPDQLAALKARPELIDLAAELTPAEHSAGCESLRKRPLVVAFVIGRPLGAIWATYLFAPKKSRAMGESGRPER